MLRGDRVDESGWFSRHTMYTLGTCWSKRWMALDSKALLEACHWVPFPTRRRQALFISPCTATAIFMQLQDGVDT